MTRLILTILAACLMGVQAVCAAPTRVAVLDDGPSARSIEKLYAQAGYSVALVKGDDLAKLHGLETPLLVIPPKSVFPPQARRELSRYMRGGGNLVDLAPNALDYAPRARDLATVVDYADESGYGVVKPASGSVSPVSLPDGKTKGLHLTSKFVWDGDLAVNVPMTDHRAVDRDVICFQARGDFEIDALRLTLEDDSGAKYVAFVELGLGWRKYAVPMADFARVGEEKDPQPVDPAKVRTLSLGLHYKVVWKDSRGSFSVGPISLARSSRSDQVPTSSVMKWANLYPRSGAPFPDWVLDPFLDSQRLSGSHDLHAALGQEIVSGPIGRSARVWSVPRPLYHRGTEDVEVGDDLKANEMRRIPLIQATSTDHAAPVTVAEIRTHTGGPYAKSSLILFGIGDGDFSSAKPLGKALIAASDYVTATPRIVRVRPITTQPGEEPAQLCCRVTVTNPRPSAVYGRVTLSLAEGRMKGSAPVSMKPCGAFTDITVKLGEVPPDFPMTRFAWRAELSAGGKRDVVTDEVNAERTLIESAIYMMNAQKGHSDGRFSIYFFTDIYTARTLFALSNYLRDPEVWKRNAELLAGMRPSDFADSAFRFCDMVVSRQTSEGGLPIGYAERDNLIFTADDGSIVLGLLQIASWMADDARAKRYTDAARRYFAFRESLYITAEKSQSLQERFGKDSPGTQEGFYGLGVLNSDMLKKGGGRWPAPRIEERGLYWVMPISMGSVCALQLLDPSNPDYRKVTLRDATEIVREDFPIARVSYFHVEGLVWMMQVIHDPELRAGLLKKIEASIPFTLGQEDTLLYFQGRGALHWLNLAYYRKMFRDTPDTRAAMAQAVWTLCSDATPCSLRTLAARYPVTAYGPASGGYRCISHSAIAFMEMLKPGSTLFKGAE